MKTSELLRAYLLDELPEQEEEKVKHLLEEDEDFFHACLELAVSAVANDLSKDDLHYLLDKEKIRPLAALP